MSLKGLFLIGLFLRCAASAVGDSAGDVQGESVVDTRTQGTYLGVHGWLQRSVETFVYDVNC